MALFAEGHPAPEGRSGAVWERASASLPFTALETKAVYVAGLIRHFVESAGYCLEEERHLPAYLLAMGGIEAMGAVARPGSRSSHDIAADGLSFIADVPREDDQVVLSTTSQAYTIRDCLHRRDFTAHGGAVLTSGVVLDDELTVGLLCLLVAALDRWWASLRSDLQRQRTLAIADVVPLTSDGWVVFVEQLREPLTNNAMPGGELQHQGWRESC